MFAAFWGEQREGSAYLTSIAYRIFFFWLIPPSPLRSLILSGIGSFTWLLNGPRLEFVAADWRVQC